MAKKIVRRTRVSVGGIAPLSAMENNSTSTSRMEHAAGEMVTFTEGGSIASRAPTTRENRPAS